MEKHILVNPEITLIELRQEYDLLQSQIETLVNQPKPHSQWQVDDYIDLRRQQLAIEAQVNTLFINN